jgi:hypothetical protein
MHHRTKAFGSNRAECSLRCVFWLKIIGTHVLIRCVLSLLSIVAWLCVYHDWGADAGWICWTCPNPKNRSGQVRVTFELSTAWTSPRMGGHRNCSRAFFRGDGIRCSSKCPAVTQKIRSKAMVWRFLVLFCGSSKKKSWSLWEYEYIYLGFAYVSVAWKIVISQSLRKVQP